MKIRERVERVVEIDNLLTYGDNLSDFQIAKLEQEKNDLFLKWEDEE